MLSTQSSEKAFTSYLAEIQSIDTTLEPTALDGENPGASKEVETRSTRGPASAEETPDINGLI